MDVNVLPLSLYSCLRFFFKGIDGKQQYLPCSGQGSTHLRDAAPVKLPPIGRVDPVDTRSPLYLIVAMRLAILTASDVSR